MSVNSTEPQKPVKTSKPRVRVSPLRLLGIFSVMLTCFMFLMISSFISVNLPDLSNFDRVYSYVPQIPAVLMIATLLGSACSTLTVFAYIISGLSVFVLGGGPDYVLNFSFGYILAFIPVSAIMGKFSESAPPLWKLIVCIPAGVLLIHFFGLLYTILLGVAFHEPSGFIRDWLFYESFLKIPYDIVFSLAFGLLTGLIRKYLWVLTVK